MKKPKELHNFYKSDSWRAARVLKIMSVNRLGERCGKIGIEVHHKENSQSIILIIHESVLIKII
ncbi:MAG: hypothetical protein RBQ97_01525 [Acholeplasma sp.]|nr:hypothetical protein [Acholeplasma sp.]